MSRRFKIILAVVATLLVWCIVLPVTVVMLLPQLAPHAVVRDPVRVKKIAAEIADYELPPGIEEVEASDLFIAKRVVFFSYPDKVDIEFAQFGVLDLVKDLTNDRVDSVSPADAFCDGQTIQNISARMIPIKGQPTAFLLWDCKAEAIVVRYAQGQFEGRGGVVVVVTMINYTRFWNWERFDQFLKSIR